MCVKCGVDDGKYKVCGLYMYMIDFFFHHAWKEGKWERDEQVYLGNNNLED